MPPIEQRDLFIEKRLSARERREPEAIARLRSEAELLVLLSESGITPRLLLRGEDELGPWHRLERVQIPTLAERLERTAGKLDASWIERASRVTFEALAALHEARDAGGPLLVVHADLSPANLAIDDAGTCAFILDFDLAWWRESPARDGAFRGTIAYVAPEIARGERPTPQSDLFSLAASLLHAAMGAVPRTRRGASFAALIAAAAETPILEPEHHQLAASSPGHAALVACLAHDPSERPASARAVLRMLRGLC